MISFCPTVPNGFARAESGGASFIRISTVYGGTGGGSHNHTGSGTLGNMSGTVTATDSADPGDCAVVGNGSHNHAWSYTSAAATPDYYYWSCGLIKSIADVPVPTLSYWLFDGNPGTGWEAVSADGRYLKISSTNAIVTGGAYTSWSHSHTISATSGANNASVNETQDAEYGASVLQSPHFHTISATMSDLVVTPSYVRLSLYMYRGFTHVGCCIC